MNPRLVSLDLVERTRLGFGDPASGEPYKTQRAFFDFVVGGASLYEAVGQVRDMASVIWTQPPVPSEREKAIRRLKKK